MSQSRKCRVVPRTQFSWRLLPNGPNSAPQEYVMRRPCTLCSLTTAFCSAEPESGMRHAVDRPAAHPYCFILL